VRRAVLDTNVIVSGVIAAAGPPRRILTGWRRREFELLASPALIDEVVRVLSLPRIARRYRVTAEETSTIAHLLMSRAILFTDIPPIPPTSRDPADDHILALATAGDADHLVSGDDDLLALRTFQDIAILPPAAYAALLDAAR
jgi:hypothetical protein